MSIKIKRPVLTQVFEFPDLALEVERQLRVMSAAGLLTPRLCSPGGDGIGKPWPPCGAGVFGKCWFLSDSEGRAVGHLGLYRPL